MAKPKKVEVKKPKTLVEKKKQITDGVPFEIKELDGNFAIVLEEGVDKGDTVKIEFLKKGNLEIQTTEAVEDNQIVFSLPEKLEIVKVLIEKPSTDKLYKVTLTLDSIDYVSEDNDLGTAIFNLKPTKISSQAIVKVQSEGKEAVDIINVFQLRRILANKTSSFLLGEKLKMKLKTK